MQKEVLGEKYANTIITKSWIARCLCDNQQFDSAEKTFRDLETRQKDVLGENHENSLMTKYCKVHI